MNTKRFLAIIVVAVILLPAVAQISKTYMQIVEDAEANCMKGRWDDAEHQLQTAMRLEPDNPLNVMLMANLGMIRYYQGNDSMALATLDSAHRMAPKTTVILENRAQVLLSINRIEDAMADYDTIITLDSLNTYSRYIRGLLHLQKGDTVAAALDFEALDRLAPDSLDTNIAWASYASYTGDWQQAERRLNRVISQDAAPEFLIERARARIHTDNLQGASDDLARVLLHHPKNAEAYLLRARVNYLRYRFDDAAADARKAVSLGACPEEVAPYLKK